MKFHSQLFLFAGLFLPRWLIVMNINPVCVTVCVFARLYVCGHEHIQCTSLFSFRFHWVCLNENYCAPALRLLFVSRLRLYIQLYNSLLARVRLITNGHAHYTFIAMYRGTRSICARRNLDAQRKYAWPDMMTLWVCNFFFLRSVFPFASILHRSDIIAFDTSDFHYYLFNVRRGMRMCVCVCAIQKCTLNTELMLLILKTDGQLHKAIINALTTQVT